MYHPLTILSNLSDATANHTVYIPEYVQNYMQIYRLNFRELVKRCSIIYVISTECAYKE